MEAAGGGGKPVVHPLPVSAGDHEAGLFQISQMTGRGRLGRIETPTMSQTHSSRLSRFMITIGFGRTVPERRFRSGSWFLLAYSLREYIPHGGTGKSTNCERSTIPRRQHDRSVARAAASSGSMSACVAGTFASFHGIGIAASSASKVSTGDGPATCCSGPSFPILLQTLWQGVDERIQSSGMGGASGSQDQLASQKCIHAYVSSV